MTTLNTNSSINVKTRKMKYPCIKIMFVSVTNIKERRFIGKEFILILSYPRLWS
jgi:hypothetical protein